MRFWSVVLVAGLLLGCAKPAPRLPPADHTYSTRGVVERLPSRSDAHVMILHEALPNFIGIDGESSTMQSMAMPFALAPGVSGADLRDGTTVAFTFEVRWTGGEPLVITKLEILPEDTTLELAD